MQVEGMERLKFERKGSMLVSDLRHTYLPKVPWYVQLIYMLSKCCFAGKGINFDTQGWCNGRFRVAALRCNTDEICPTLHCDGYSVLKPAQPDYDDIG